MNKKIVVVTGASRGVGKGIALAFAKAGAKVYVTGRTAHSSGSSLPGSLDETVTEINALGGEGVAVVCDHSKDDDVKGLFDQVAATDGVLDVLVNNATALHRDLVAPGGFWEKSLDLVKMIDVGLRSSYVASYYAAPLMLGRSNALIASTSFYGARSYFHGPAYGAQKAGLDKMSFDMAVELRPHNVAALSFWPGFVRTEFVQILGGNSPERLKRLESYESPTFVGEVVVALANDAELMSMSGQAVIIAEQARRYGITDNGVDRQSYRETMGSPLEFLSINE